MSIYRNRTLRLTHYDYKQNGLYFITISTQNKTEYFGKIAEDVLIINDAGKMVEKLWLELSSRFDFISLHEYIIMPNHFHGILEIMDSQNVHLGEIIGIFKSLSTNAYIKGVRNSNWSAFNKRLWQKNYYEHIIRNKASYLHISDYIINNPLRWKIDKFYV